MTGRKDPEEDLCLAVMVNDPDIGMHVPGASQGRRMHAHACMHQLGILRNAPARRTGTNGAPPPHPHSTDSREVYALQAKPPGLD